MSKAARKTERTIGSVAVDALRNGATNAEALEAVKREFPEAGTSMPCINWYRSTLRRAGEPVPTGREARKWERALA